MTHDELDKLEAGVDLDALIAEKVMGWKLTPRNTYPTIDWDQWCDETGALCGQRPRGFSTDIAAAWEVHRLQREQIFSKRRVYLDALADEIQNIGGSNVRVAFPDALMFLSPLAICRAALKAVSQ